MKEQETPTTRTVLHVLSLLTMTIVMILLGLIVWQTTIIGAQFQDFFNKFGVELPGFTACLLAVPSKVYFLIASCLGFIAVLKEISISNCLLKLLINLVLGVVLLIGATLYHFALIYPYMSFLQNMQ